MRTKGAITKKLCFNLKVVNNEGEEMFNGDFITLKDIAKHLGFTYNQVVEITRKRKKKKEGKYEINYLITSIGKIKEIIDEVNEACLDDEGNIIDEFLYESALNQSEPLNL
tara:strand:+ start:179 stop:511 length:333 start_codon:yes stop_codon:yes gene_type:complete